MDISLFADLIKNSSGLTVSESKFGHLTSAVKARMDHHGLTSHNQYLMTLRNDREEAKHLIDLVTINESYFFREVAHFNVAVNRVFPGLRSGATAGRIQLLSAGCAGGEEPYSLLIALVERYGYAVLERVTVTGIDIDRRTIQKAREGAYTRHSFRGVEEALRDKYFVRESENRFSVVVDLRNQVEFVEVNLLELPECYTNARFDLIFYRNVSIYFDPDVQRMVFRKLAEGLRDGGHLFMSSAETMLHDLGYLELAKIDDVFCFRKTVTPAPSRRGPRYATPERQPVRRRSQAATQPPSLSGDHNNAAVVACRLAGDDLESGERAYGDAVEKVKRREYEAALTSLESLPQTHPFAARARCLAAGIAINRGRLDDGRAICEAVIADDPWVLESHLLLALVSRLEGDVVEAVKKFRSAVYIDQACWIAHYYLGEMYEEQGDVTAARREYAIVVKLLEKDNGDNRNYAVLFALSFPLQEVMQMCRRRIAAM